MEQYEKNGKTYTLTQALYLEGTYENTCYEAHANDEDGNHYKLHWEAYIRVDERFEDGCEYEFEARDWNKFIVRPA